MPPVKHFARPLSVFFIVLLICLFVPPTTVHASVMPDFQPISRVTVKKTIKLPILTLTSTVAPINPPTPTGNIVANCGDNSYANYIYEHESSCNTGAENPEGCLGIGQACPGSKLLAVCPLLDYACENSFFTNYANSVYGGWYMAYVHETDYGWW